MADERLKHIGGAETWLYSSWLQECIFPKLKKNESLEDHRQEFVDKYILWVRECEAEEMHSRMTGEGLKPESQEERDARINDLCERVRATMTKLATRITEADEVWAFCSDEASWATLSGRAGLAILRDGALVAIQITSLS